MRRGGRGAASHHGWAIFGVAFDHFTSREPRSRTGKIFLLSLLFLKTHDFAKAFLHDQNVCLN